MSGVCLERKIEARQLVNIISLFLVVQFGGLLIAIFITGPMQLYLLPTAGTQQTNPLEMALFYIIYIIITAVVIILIFKFYRGRFLFSLLEAFVVLFATGFVIFAILGTIFQSANPYLILAISAVATALLIIEKNFTPKLRNFLAVTSSIGVGILIGFNGFALSYFLMLFIAIYDYIAVFITKHMVSMAKEMSSRNLAFLIGSSDVEAVPSSYLSKQEMRTLKKETKDPRIKDPLIKRLMKKGVYPLISQVQLGSGDLAIPLMVAVGAYISFASYFAAVMVVIGAAFGMLFTMYLLKKYKVALPAIPPLFAFINLSLAVLFMINDFGNIKLWLSFLMMFAAMSLLLLQKLRRPQKK